MSGNLFWTYDNREQTFRQDPEEDVMEGKMVQGIGYCFREK